MDLLEISEKHRMTREQAAKVLHDIADQLARQNKLSFERDGIKLRVDVPNQVELEIELEVETGESSLELEIKW